MDIEAILAELGDTGSLTIVAGHARPGKQRRATRPGQIAPSARSGYRAGLNRHLGNADDRTDSAERERPVEDSDYVKKMQRLAENWNSRRPGNTEKYTISFPRALKVRESRKLALLGIVQKEIDSAIAAARSAHPCCTLLDDGGDASCLELIRNASIVYHEIGWRGVLTAPIYKCTKCCETIFVSPLDVGCAGTAPTEACETWVSQDMARIFQDMHLNNGLSANGEWLLRLNGSLPLLDSLLTAAPLSCSMGPRFEQFREEHGP